MDNMSFTKDEVLKIAKEQKTLCWLFLGIIVSYFLTVIIIGIITVLVFSIWAIVKVYHLAKALKKDSPILYVIGMLIPIVKLFVLLSVIQSSTKILRANNIDVGIMGAREESLETYKISQSA